MANADYLQKYESSVQKFCQNTLYSELRIVIVQGQTARLLIILYLPNSSHCQ